MCCEEKKINIRKKKYRSKTKKIVKLYNKKYFRKNKEAIIKRTKYNYRKKKAKFLNIPIEECKVTEYNIGCKKKYSKGYITRSENEVRNKLLGKRSIDIAEFKEKKKKQGIEFREKKRKELTTKSEEDLKKYKEERRKYFKERYLKNKEKIKEKNKEKNKEKKKNIKYDRELYLKNRDKIKLRRLIKINKFPDVGIDEIKNKIEEENELKSIEQLYEYKGFLSKYKKITKSNYEFIKLEYKVRKIIQIADDATYIQMLFFSNICIQNCKYIVPKMTEESYNILEKYINSNHKHIESILKIAKYFAKSYLEYAKIENEKKLRVEKLNKYLRDNKNTKNKLFKITKVY